MDNFLQGAMYALVGFAVIYFYMRLLPKMDLQHKFKKLGNMSGKHKDEIVKKAGKPKLISYEADGGQLIQWHAGGYHISLLFDKDGNFIRVVNEAGL